jgi:uncharacterized membrane protein
VVHTAMGPRAVPWVLRGVVGVIAVCTAIGLAVLWPRGEVETRAPAGPPPDLEPAEVVSVRSAPCQNPVANRCALVGAKLTEGPDKDKVVTLRVGDAGDDVPSVGDKVRLFHVDVPPGSQVNVSPYSLADYERRAPILWLGIAFSLLVILTGRWRGVLSLVGLALSLSIVLFFIVPAILHGESPLAVAVIGSLAIMLATIPLAHGVGPKSLAACIGTTASLLLTAGLAVFATDLTHLSGFASEEAIRLQVDVTGLSITGLVVAGMVIGALGVLDDVTVSQSSTVMALFRANPRQGFVKLFTEGLSVGRDHIAATVNTLVLAYVGAALPVLLVFSVGQVGFGNAVNSEVVATEIVAMLVGSIGLIAAVPLTTGLAALAARRMSPADLSDVHAAHAH